MINGLCVLDALGDGASGFWYGAWLHAHDARGHEEHGHGPFCGGEQLHGACPPRGPCEPLRSDEQLKHGGGDHDGVSLFPQSF